MEQTSGIIKYRKSAKAAPLLESSYHRRAENAKKVWRYFLKIMTFLLRMAFREILLFISQDIFAIIVW